MSIIHEVLLSDGRWMSGVDYDIAVAGASNTEDAAKALGMEWPPRQCRCKCRRAQDRFVTCGHVYSCFLAC